MIVTILKFVVVVKHERSTRDSSRFFSLTGGIPAYGMILLPASYTVFLRVHRQKLILRPVLFAGPGRANTVLCQEKWL